ncbi:unnamed protein product [Orchesella dallaii]|uniref:Auto-transporter adhesin head GIN domain-containing protein n=1 Tax=Orchesella dallaii TaxID=48710 RepID=A0ABP1PPI9_9HEXA
MQLFHSGLVLLVGCLVCLIEAKKFSVKNAKELQKALDEASPGDTIGLGPEDFKGAFVITKDGKQGSPITLVADDQKFKEKCRIIGEGSKAALTVKGHFWNLRYFAIENKNSEGLLIEGSNNTVSSIVVEFVKKSIHVKGESNTLEDVTVRDASEGINLEGSYNNVKRSAVIGAKPSLLAAKGTCCGNLEGNSFDSDMDMKGSGYKTSLNVINGKPQDEA